MPKPRGREHTSLTETATVVVRVLERIPGIKMIAPGEIRIIKNTRTGKRFVTASYTMSGMELLISGQSVQKVSVHTERPAKEIFSELKKSKRLQNITFKERERKPGT